MTTATLSFTELDTDASILTAAAKRVRLAVAKGEVWALVRMGCWYLRRARKYARRVQLELAQLHIQTAEDRAWLLNVARALGESATALQSAHQQVEQKRLARFVPGGALYVSRLGDLAMAVEDLAETAALAASAEFCIAVQDEIRTHLDAHARTHQGAHA